MKKYLIKIINKDQNIYKHFETNYILEAEDVVKHDNKKYEVIFREINGLEDCEQIEECYKKEGIENICPFIKSKDDLNKQCPFEAFEKEK